MLKGAFQFLGKHRVRGPGQDPFHLTNRFRPGPRTLVVKTCPNADMHPVLKKLLTAALGFSILANKKTSLKKAHALRNTNFSRLSIDTSITICFAFRRMVSKIRLGLIGRMRCFFDFRDDAG